MIVTCTSCCTRFRVPPGKIGPNGARLRCSRCRAVFEVGPEPAGDEPAAVPGPGRPEPTRVGSPPGDAAPVSDPPWPAPVSPATAPPDDPFAALDGDPFAGAPVFSEARLQPAGPDPVEDDETTRLAELLDPHAVAPIEVPADLDLDLEPAEPRPPGIAGAADGRREQVGLGSGLELSEPVAAWPEPLPEVPRPPPASAGVAHAAPPPRSGPGQDPTAVAPPRPSPGSAHAAEAGTESPAPATAEGESTQLLEPTAERGKARAFTAEALWLALLVVLSAALVLGWRSGFGVRAGSRARSATVELTGLRAVAYPTAGGGAATVVAGDVLAHERVPGRVRVWVELVRDGAAIASAETLAGGEASPEEVFEGATPEKVAALRRTVEARATPGLSPGQRARFLVVFPAPAPDPASVELRARAEAEALAGR